MSKDIRKFYPPSESSLPREENNDVEREGVGHETEPTAGSSSVQPRKKRQNTKSLTPEEIERQLIESQDSQDPDFLPEEIIMECDNLDEVPSLTAGLAEQEAKEEGLLSQPEAGPSALPGVSGEDSERGLKVLQECLAGLGG